MLRLYLFSDTVLYAEAVSAVLDDVPWIASSHWQIGIDELPDWNASTVPDLVLVMCDANLRPAWIRHLTAETGRGVVVVGVGTDESEVVVCAEAGVSGFLFCDQSIADLQTVVKAAASNELVCPPRVAAMLMRRVRSLAGERRQDLRMALLTVREQEVLQLIDAGRSNKEIATRLAIDLCTVKNHVHHIIQKLEVSRRGEAAALLHT